jgi:hypothetical protein
MTEAANDAAPVPPEAPKAPVAPVVAAPKTAAPPPKPLDLAPEGTDCPHCGQRMRVFARYTHSTEYCCPTLKEEAPVLADKYAEWRDLYLKSRVTRPN